ncbi:MAG: domain/sensory box/EAL domain protein [Chitinophagaceae bacterium]|nr:domain/sensory box/EAL domain protein [Chitinophagaceae bacterium]
MKQYFYFQLRMHSILFAIFKLYINQNTLFIKDSSNPLAMDNIYKKVLQDALGSYWEYNFLTNELYLSPEFMEGLGYPDHEEKTTRDKLKDKVFPEDASNSANALAEHVASKGEIPYLIEVRYIHKDGHTIWMQSSGRIISWTEDGQPIQMVGCQFDITKQKELELQLKHSQIFLNKTNEVARIGGWEVDFKNDIVYWQPMTKIIHEVPEDYKPDLSTAIDFYTPESREKVIEALKNALELGTRYDLELELITAKGRKIWTRAIGLPEFSEGKCIRLIGTIQDIDREKKTQQELEKSEEQFRTAFKYSAIGMALVSVAGKWMKVNQKLCDIVGYSEAEMLQKTFIEMTHPDDVATDVALVERSSREKLENIQREKRYLHKNGDVIWVLVNISILKNTDGTSSHFIAQIQDITERKEKENELMKVNQELTSLFDSDAHVAIIATDTKGLITHFSKGAELLLGYTREEVVNRLSPLAIHLAEEVEEKRKKVSELLDKPVKLFNALTELASIGIYDSQEWTYVRKDQTTFPVQVDITAIKDGLGNITGYIGIATDISQILATKEALRQSDQRWQFALEGSSNGVWDWNMITNEVFYSHKWKSLIGYEEHEIPNTYETWSSRVHPEDLERCQKDLQMHYTGHSPSYINEHRMLCKDGTYKWILTKGKVIERTIDHKPVRVMGTHTDITWQKEKEDELSRTLDIVSEQNKRLLNFAYIVSHNLRSHSSNFKLLLDVIDVSETREELYEAMHHLKDIYYSLDETVKNLNEIIKIQTNISNQREEINLYQYVEKTTDLLRGEIKQRQAIIRNGIKKDQSILYNPAYMESILLNLITNAIKYRHPDRAPQISLSVYHDNNWLVLEIKDNGLGIDLSLHGQKLFGMYKTFHGNSDAKGIGLFITKNQVDAMGGKIEVLSEVDKGSTFRIFFS